MALGVSQQMSYGSRVNYMNSSLTQLMEFNLQASNQKNVNRSIADTLAAFDDVVPRARAAGLAVRAYLSTCFGCPYG